MPKYSVSFTALMSYQNFYSFFLPDRNFDPLPVVIDGVTVLVRLEIGHYSDPYPDTYYTGKIRADVEYETDSDLPSSELFEPVRQAAARAISRTLIHLKRLTNAASIDTNVSSLILEYHRDASGNQMPGHIDSLRTPSTYVRKTLVHETWQEVCAAVVSDMRIPLEDMFLMESDSFMELNNYNMAPANAAIACELLMGKVIIERLMSGEGVTRSLADRFTSETSNRELPTLLLFFGLASLQEVEMIRETFVRRNEIFHGQRRRPITQQEAINAVESARLLKSIASR